MGKKRASESNVEDQVRRGTPPRIDSDGREYLGTCGRCQLVLWAPSQNVAQRMDGTNSWTHTTPGVCIEALREKLDMAQEELANNRAARFGAYTEPPKDVILYSGPRFIDLVKVQLEIGMNVTEGTASQILDFAYEMVHSGLQFEPEDNDPPRSKEYHLARELVQYFLHDQNRPAACPTWLQGLLGRYT